MNDQIDPEQLPFQISELGEIKRASQPYPGVYYVAVLEAENDGMATEYYIVLKNTAIISQTVKEYGKVLPGHSELLFYSMTDDRSGWRLVDYEGHKYLAEHHLPLPERPSLHENAVFSMEHHPEYFGTYPVPMVTPAGYTLRHKQLENGIYWLETDSCKKMLAVCYPVWFCELSKAAKSLGQQTEYDQVRGIDKTLGYLFFLERNSCIPLFELLRFRPEWTASGDIDSTALMNAIWVNFPEYVISHNLGEQAGANDLLGTLLNTFGADLE